ncbi:LysR family transcriptional regulator [Amycolatopsis sp. lyj-90]|uniref:LysR family transcriptional regulator n=1 Tax=Amycolatopsis sp. lyj-90 TaxID=2789285 RepID=UPI00397B8864
MPDPEIRELRYFRAVAEELNITRAAGRLGIAQPPLSRAIRGLERRIGAELFDRTGRRLALTSAGETLLAESVRVLAALDVAVHRTRRVGNALVVTAKPGVATRLLHRVRERFREDPAAVEIRVVVSGFGEQAELVRDGRADLAIAACVDGDGLETELLTSEPRVAALAADHELAGRDVLSVADLIAEPAPRWADARIVEPGHWLGHPDRRSDGPVVRDTAQLLDVVSFGQAVALVPASLADVNVRPDVVYRPVGDVTPYRTLALWRQGSRSPSIAGFLRIAAEHGSVETLRSRHH